MNVAGMQSNSYQTLFASIIEAHELIRRYSDKKQRRQLLEFLPAAAANQYLFGAQMNGTIAAVGIGGPTDKPRGLFNFRPDGTRLFVYYMLVHPKVRKYAKTRQLFNAMLNQALEVFPDVETICFYRGPKFHEERTKDRWQRSLRWAGAEARAAEPVGMPSREERLTNSRQPSRDPSRDSSSASSSMTPQEAQSLRERLLANHSSSNGSSLAPSQPGLGMDVEPEVPEHSHRI